LLNYLSLTQLPSVIAYHRIQEVEIGRQFTFTMEKGD
jgi:hypothetical protein